MSRIGPYTILRRLAVGGMAEVFLARRDGPAGVAKILAVKRILPHLSEDPDFVAMFLDEARIASRLSHPNIVQLHDFGEADGTYFLAMEYVPGEDAHTLLRRCGESGTLASFTIVATILIAACEALHHAHELRDAHDRPLRLVHRDVTPSNLLVSYDGVVKLADFGIAKVESRGPGSVSGSPKGKVPYMSPEQVLAKPLDRRSDLFSLAAVGHELLTGRRLFHNDSELLLLKAITEQPVEAPSARRADVPPALDRIIMRALERDPDQRFASAQAMQLELERFLAEHGSVGGKLELARFMHELFGDNAAAMRRRLAAGDADDGEPTRALPSAPRKPATATRRRWPLVVALAGVVAALGVGALAMWPARTSSQRVSGRDAAVVATVVAEPSGSGSGSGSGSAAPPPVDEPAVGDRGSARPSPAWSYLSVDRGEPLDVSLDNHPVGTAPIARRKIKPGPHTLVLNGREGNRLTTRFVVRAGDEHAERGPLQRGSLSCDVTPWADVYLGARKLGTTPLAAISLTEGTYTLRLVNSELHHEQNVPVTVRPGETTRLKFSLVDH